MRLRSAGIGQCVVISSVAQTRHGYKGNQRFRKCFYRFLRSILLPFALRLPAQSFGCIDGSAASLLHFSISEVELPVIRPERFVTIL